MVIKVRVRYDATHVERLPSLKEPERELEMPITPKFFQYLRAVVPALKG